MLFGKRKQVVKRILIVEDEPLTAFDNENMLGDAGYEIVATVDDLDEAIKALDREEVHLIVSDVRLRKDQTGVELGREARKRGVPVLFVTGHPHPQGSEVGIGCLLKPYSQRQLCSAIECVDRHLQGHKVKAPKANELSVGTLQITRSMEMAKKATGTGGVSKTGSRGGSRSKTSVARASSAGGGGGSGSGEKFDASEAFVKLLQSPLVAELVAVAATAALAALAAEGFTSSSTRGRRAGNAVKAAGKAAAAAVGRRLSTEMEEIRNAANAKRGAGA